MALVTAIEMRFAQVWSAISIIVKFIINVSKIGNSLDLIKSTSHQLKRDCFFIKIETKCTFKINQKCLVKFFFESLKERNHFKDVKCDPFKCKEKTIEIRKKQPEIKDKSEN